MELESSTSSQHPHATTKAGPSNPNDKYYDNIFSDISLNPTTTKGLSTKHKPLDLPKAYQSIGR